MSDKEVKVGKYKYKLSSRKNKKLMTVVNGKEIHFGNINYKHFFDRTGLLPKSLNHNDKDRQTNYLKRAKGIKNKEGKLTWKDPKSPNHHAIKILW